MKNINKILNQVVGNINTHYDLTAKEVIQLLESSNDSFDIVLWAFDIGYYQGVKATQNSTPWETTRKKSQQNHKAIKKEGCKM